MDAYLIPLIEQRLNTRGNDMVSLLLQAEEDGDRLTRDDVIRTLSGFIVGGTDTTQHALATALYLFAKHPEQWDLLSENEQFARNAADEVLRYLPVGAIQTRVAQVDVDVNGIHVPARTKVYASLISVNHDPRIYPDPERFDIQRTIKPMHLAFGFGRHGCLGLHLARFELEEALLVLARTFKSLRIDGDVDWQPPTTFQGPRRLPLAVEWRQRHAPRSGSS
jgi:cytochrome P450